MDGKQGEWFAVTALPDPAAELLIPATVQSVPISIGASIALLRWCKTTNKFRLKSGTARLGWFWITPPSPLPLGGSDIDLLPDRLHTAKVA